MENQEELMRAAAAADAGDPLPDLPAGAQAVPSQAADADGWKAAAVQVGGLVRRFVPQAAEWRDADLENFGAELANVAQHYGIRFGDVLDHPLLRLGAASIPLALPFVLPLLQKRQQAEGGEPAAVAP